MGNCEVCIIIEKEEIKNFIFAINQYIGNKDHNRKNIREAISALLEKKEFSALKNDVERIKLFIIDEIHESLKDKFRKSSNSNDIKLVNEISEFPLDTSKENDDADYNLNDFLMNSTLGFINNYNPLESINMLIELNRDYKLTKQIEKTKREKIKADKEVFLKKINAQKRFLITYLEKTFDERKNVFEKYFKVVDDALEHDNIQQLSFGIDGIVKLSKESPFKGLEDLTKVQQNLLKDNTTWDF
jgi:hypothetical protein